MLKYLEGVEGAAEDKQAIVAQRCYHPQSGQIADQVHLTDTGVIIDHLKKGRSFSSCINKCIWPFPTLQRKPAHTCGGSMMRSATIIPSCKSMSRKAMTNCAQADIKRGFLVQIFFLLPARIRAMRLVWIKNRSNGYAGFNDVDCGEYILHWFMTIIPFPVLQQQPQPTLRPSTSTMLLLQLAIIQSLEVALPTLL